MVNNSLYLLSGEDATVRLGVHITIDCKQLMNNLKDKGEPNCTITWTNNGLILTNASKEYVFLSEDKTLSIVTRIKVATADELGNDGNYTCKVCGGNGTAECERETSCLKVCGKIELF